MTTLPASYLSAADTAVALRIPLPEPSAQDLFQSAVHCVDEDLRLVERRLKNLLQSRVEGVPEMMAYLIDAGGKRIRPLVTCLLAKACGYRGDLHVDIAAVAELLHTATLYHDDVVDEARLRRGKPTANHLFGNKVIVLAGDLMLAHSFSLLMEGGHFSISRALSRTVRDMVEGEILQLQYEGNLDITLEDYLEMIRHKTASLFSWCGQAASMISGGSPDESRRLAQFGQHIGIAFQLVDDLIDFTGDSDTTGKNTLNDLREGKVTLPLLLVLQQHPEFKADVRHEFDRLEGGSFAPVFLKRLQSFIRSPQVLAESTRLINQTLDDARKNLADLEPSIYRTHLNSLLDFLARRDR